jgi:hypothetical protein
MAGASLAIAASWFSNDEAYFNPPWFVNYVIVLVFSPAFFWKMLSGRGEFSRRPISAPPRPASRSAWR